MKQKVSPCMQKIKIETIYPNDCGGYEIPLGNGCTQSFKNLKEASAFLAATNQFLTEKAFTITCIYTELYQKYRAEFWHLVHFQDTRKIESELSIADDTLKHAYLHSTMKVGHILTFINLEKSVKALQRVIIILRDLDKGRSNTTNNYFFKSLQTQLLQITADISAYSKTTAIELNDFPEACISSYKSRPTVFDLRLKKRAV